MQTTAVIMPSTLMGTLPNCLEVNSEEGQLNFLFQQHFNFRWTEGSGCTL